MATTEKVDATPRGGKGGKGGVRGGDLSGENGEEEGEVERGGLGWLT
jgi:hypothetical protein